MPQTFMELADAARAAGVSVSTVRRATEAGELPVAAVTQGRQGRLLEPAHVGAWSDRVRNARRARLRRGR